MPAEVRAVEIAMVGICRRANICFGKLDVGGCSRGFRWQCVSRVGVVYLCPALNHVVSSWGTNVISAHNYFTNMVVSSIAASSQNNVKDLRF